MAEINLNIHANFDALQRAGSHVEALSRESLRLNQTMNTSFRNSAGAVDAFDSNLRRANADLNTLERHTQTAGRSLAGANQQAESFGKSLSSMATGFVAGTVITGGLSKISQAFTHAIEIQREFEKSIQNLSAITGASGADLDFYKAKALELGITVKGGATAVVEAFKLIGSAKPELLANKEALAQVTEQAILLSQASGLELPDAATRLTDAMNQFGAASDQAGLFVDTLAAAAKFGAAEVPQVTDALLKFGAVAKSSHISIQESAAAIELLGEKGLKGAEAGTALRNVFLKLSAVNALPKEALAQLKRAGVDTEVLGDKSKTLMERLTELSKIQGNETALVKVFGTENVVAAKSIIAGTQAIDGHLPRLAELTKQIGEQGLGTATEQAAKNLDTMDHALLETTNKYDNLILSMTSGDMGEIMKGMVKKFNLSLDVMADGIHQFGVIFNKGFAANALEIHDEAIKKSVANLSDVKKKFYVEDLRKSIILLNNQIQNNDKLTAAQRQGALSILKDKNTALNALLALQKEGVKAAENISQAEADKDVEITDAELKRRQKLQEDFAKAILDLRKRVEKAQLEQAAPVEKIELERKFAQEELDLYQAQFIKVGQLVNKNFKLSLEQQQQFEFLRTAINMKAAEEQIKIEVDKQNKIAQARLGKIKATESNLGIEETNAVSVVELAKKPDNLSEVNFEKIKQEQIIAIQIDFAKRKLELKQASLEAEREVAVKAANGELTLLAEKNDAESEKKKKDIVENLSLTEQKFALEGQAAKDATDKYLNSLDKKLADLNKKPKFNLLEELGLTKDDLSNISMAFTTVIKSMDEAYDRQLKVNEGIIESSKSKQETLQSEIDALNSKLEEEKDLGARGLANNTSKIQAEIALKQQQQEAQKILELKALEDKKRIQKQKLILDTALQASNLLVAATEIYAKAAASSGPYGIPIAVAAIGIMLGAFVLQKAAAFKAINEGQNFAKGKIGIEGPGTETSDDIPANLSKGESVITAKVTRKRRNLLEALLRDNEADVTHALLNELRHTGVTLDAGLPKELMNKKESIKNIENINLRADNSKMEKELTEVRKTLQMINVQNKTKTYLDQNGNLVTKKGSHTSVIRKKNG